MKVYYIDKLSGRAYYLDKSCLRWKGTTVLLSPKELRENYIRVSTQTFEELDAALERARALRKSRREKGIEGIHDFVSDVEGDWLENWEADAEYSKASCIIGGKIVKVSWDYLGEFLKDNADVIQVQKINRRGPLRWEEDSEPLGTVIKEIKNLPPRKPEPEAIVISLSEEAKAELKSLLESGNLFEGNNLTPLKEYRYQVNWSEEDQEWVGTHKDYPSLSYLSSDKNEALAGIKELVEDYLTSSQMINLTKEDNEELTKMINDLSEPGLPLF